MLFLENASQKLEKIYIFMLSRMYGLKDFHRSQHLSTPSHVLAWIRDKEMGSGGIRLHSNDAHAYPNITGYLVPTLIHYGDQELARRLVRWLIASQRADGSFMGPDDGKDHIFNTGQVLRGLLAAAEIEPLAKESACRAAGYLYAGMCDQGRGGFGERYDGSIPESVHLYVLPPLIEASVVLGNSLYREAADNCLRYYTSHRDALQIGDLTHFLAYQLEALIDLGHTDLALPVLEQLEKIQKRGGAIRGVDGKNCICTPGLAQLAICWYKVGHWEPADKAMIWLERHQSHNGGWRGSYGFGASYFPKVELTSAAKFYLDAHRLRSLSLIERHADIFSEEITTEDGRLETLLSVVGPGDRIVEVGCGKGSFLKAIKSLQPDTECTGVDISTTILSCLPEGIKRLEGSLEQVSCPENSFDIIFSVELIKHTVNVDAAIKEMIRIAKPGGWVIVFEKQERECECVSGLLLKRWPQIKYLAERLNRDCDHVTSAPVSYDDKRPDRLMVVLRGQKRSRLTGEEWNKTLVAPVLQSDLLNRLRSNKFSPWGLEILLATHYNERVLEIGSGTGEISLALAMTGRKVMVMDISSDSLEFTQRCAKALGVEIEVLLADAIQPLPLPDNDVDCVWSSGLLEHFSPQERHQMLKDWRRVTRDRVITLVPNATSVAYRAGKTLQEKEGRWPYGLEGPIRSLHQEYDEAGLRVISEFTIGARHSLNFLPIGHPLRQSLSTWMDSLSYEELMDCNQGYMLITIGTKRDDMC